MSKTKRREAQQEANVSARRPSKDAFDLGSLVRPHPRHTAVIAALEQYRDDMQSELERPPSTRDLATIDSVLRCRAMILLLNRRVLNRGLSTKTKIRPEVVELRQWLRLESDLLSQLQFKREPSGAKDLRAMWDESEKGPRPDQGRGEGAGPPGIHAGEKS